MKRALYSLIFLTALALVAQQPGGDKQPAGEKKPPASKPDAAKPDAAKPDAANPLGDISGTYSFLREGEFLQIDVEQDRVTGFVSRFGELESDSGAFLDHFFQKASLTGNKLTFTTRKIHGVWFEFEGTVERGEAKSRAEDGYYVVKGKLTQYSTDAGGKSSGRFREAVFKSLAVEPAEPQPAAKKPG